MKKLIIINCRFLTQPISGVQRFAIEICRELKKKNSNIIFVAPKNIIHLEIAKELGVIKIGLLKGHLWEQIELSYYVKLKKGILLSLCNTAPLLLKTQIVTIHDLCFIHNPEWFSYTFRKVYNFLIPRIAESALHIFTVSETSKNEIIERLNIEANKISVIYNAVSPIFNIQNNEIRESLSIKGKYILTVSSHHPRKNFRRLTEAFLALNNEKLKLVIVGNFNKHFISEKVNSSESIIIKENVSDEELIVLYQNAELFVYPSLYEGFGIPIIEAVSLGTSVCVSDIPVFREICGNSDIFFNPYSVESIKNKIQYALLNPSQIELTKHYTWKESAKKVYDILQLM